jgi:hypothetical protein
LYRATCREILTRNNIEHELHVLVPMHASEGQAPSERLSSVARHYTERLSVHGMAIELAIRQWARTDSAAAAACAGVDEARLKLAGQLYRDLAFRPLNLETGRYFFTHFCSGKVCCLSDTDRESLRA